MGAVSLDEPKVYTPPVKPTPKDTLVGVVAPAATTTPVVTSDNTPTNLVTPSNVAVGSYAPSEFHPRDARISFGETATSNPIEGVASPAQQAIFDAASKRFSPEQVQKFGDSFKALPPAEQKASLEIMELLSQKPAPDDLPAKLKAKVDALPPDAQGRKGMAVGRSLNQLGFNLPSTAAEAPGSEDATARLRRVHMGGYSDSNTQKGYVHDMIRVAKAENFKVVLEVSKGTDTNALKQQMLKNIPGFASVEELDKHVEFVQTEKGGYEWGEDNKWVRQNGSLVTISDADRALKEAGNFVKASTGIKPGEIGSQGYHTASGALNDPNRVVSDSNQGAVAKYNLQVQAQQLAEQTGLPITTTRSYLEGGNMLSGTLPNGDPYAVIGKDSLLISTFDLQSKKPAEFSDEAVTQRQAELGLNRDFAQLDVPTQQLVDATAKHLMRSDNIPAEYLAGARSDAMAFLAKQDIAKDIMAQDIGVPRGNVTYIDQPEFHIDMYMRPLGPGQMMLNDFDANKRLLDDALSRATPGSWDEEQLKKMLDHNEKARTAMGPVNAAITAQLQAAGIQVIPAPGVFEVKSDFFNKAESHIQERRANFMNAIPATRPGTNEQIYMTNHTSIDSLRDAYVDYMRREFGISQVYFLGGQGGAPNGFSDAENSLLADGGLDCRENH